MSLHRQNWITALGFCVLLAPGGIALAQQPSEEKAKDQQPEAEPSPAPPRLREEVTVTAQKREENIQQVPLSVTPLDAEKLTLLSEGGADVKALTVQDLTDIQKAMNAAVLATEQGTKSVEAGVKQSAVAGDSIRALAETRTTSPLTFHAPRSP